MTVDVAALLQPRRAWTRRVARLCGRRRILVLTYDDGPGAATTPRILDLLGAHGVRATFFAVGRNAVRRPEILDRAVREGHEVGCHSYSHLHPWRSAPWTAARDVERGVDAVARWACGAPLFRPPHGKFPPWTRAAARAAGARPAWWTVDSGDTWTAPPRVDDVIARVRRRRGGVVLLHDFDRAPERERFVVDVTTALVRAAREDGLSVVPLGRVVDARSARDTSGRAPAFW